MKFSIRILSLILALVLCAFSFAACGKDEEGDGDSQTGDVSTETSSNDLDARDLGAMTFKILDANDHPEMHINFAEDMDGNAVQQALYKRDIHVEERNNVNLEYTQEINTDKAGIEIFANSYQAGDREYDLIVSTASGDRLTNYACQGFFANLNDLPVLDLSQKWWSAEANKMLTLGGKIYFTTGDIMASVYDAPMAVYGNKTLLSENKIEDDLYNKVRTGEWTMEYLGEITKNLTRDVNGDNVWDTENDFYGVITQPIRMSAIGMLVGMGFENSYILNDNIIVVNDDVDLLGNLIDTIQDVVVDVDTAGNNQTVIDNAFKNDKAVFLIHLMEAANHNLRDMSSDFTILPMPKADSAQEGYRSYINGWVDCFIAVPNFSDSTYGENAGFIIESMARASYDIVRPVAFEQVIKYQSSRDVETLDMLEIIYNTLYIDFQGLFDFGGVGKTLSNVIFKDAELASSLQSIKEKTTKEAAERAAQWIDPFADNK